MQGELKSLRQIIMEKGQEYETEEIVPRLVGFVDGEPRVVLAILDRTAVVHPIGNDEPLRREVRRLEKVMVWPHDILWQKRGEPQQFGFTFSRRKPHDAL